MKKSLLCLSLALALTTSLALALADSGAQPQSRVWGAVSTSLRGLDRKSTRLNSSH